MNDDLDLSCLTDFQSRLDQPWDLIQLHETGLAENGFCANLVNLINDFLGSLLAPFRDIIDHDVGSALGKQDRNTGADSPGLWLAH